MTALAAAAAEATSTQLGWEYFTDEVVAGDWAGTPGYELLYRVEHAGHSWVTNRSVILRLDILPDLDSLPEGTRPEMTAYTPTPGNDVLARLDNPRLPSRHPDVAEGLPLFDAGLLAPLLTAGLTLADDADIDARLPQPILAGSDLVVGLLQPITPRPGFTQTDSIYITHLTPFLTRAHAALTTWAALAGVCDRELWRAAAALENSAAFTLRGGDS